MAHRVFVCAGRNYGHSLVEAIEGSNFHQILKVAFPKSGFYDSLLINVYGTWENRQTPMLSQQTRNQEKGQTGPELHAYLNRLRKQEEASTESL